jgi:hypothetical protein
LPSIKLFDNKKIPILNNAIPKKSFSLKTKYIPSLYAINFNIRGAKSLINEKAGFGVRNIGN